MKCSLKKKKWSIITTPNCQLIRGYTKKILHNSEFYLNIHISSVKILCLNRKRTVFWAHAEVSCLVFPWLSVGTPLACDKETRTNLLEASEKPNHFKESHSPHLPLAFQAPTSTEELLPSAKEVPILFQVSSKLILMKFWWFLKTFHWFNIDSYDDCMPSNVLGAKD